MDSVTLFGRAKCKRNVPGKVCTCQEWVPSEKDESLCECCGDHMSFHEPLDHPIASGYGRCVRKCDDARPSHEDGCQEFFPLCASSSSKCAGCGCHRSYHEKVTVAVGELAGPSNVHLQQQDFLQRDDGPSTSLLQSSSKRLKLDRPNISMKADSGHDGFRRDLKYESDMVVLEPKHKVFLSHSGAQKDFVEQLCIDLETCDRYPFFDKRKSSLPVGMKFPERLFAAIQQSEVGVVVLSEEFFSKTKWPMLELVEMVRSSASMIIVPVFLSITREECRKLESLERWIPRWKEWAEKDKTIDIEEWKLALKIFGSTTSLSYKDGEVALRKEVVDAVCELVLPESRWDDSNVEGKDRLCKVILDKVGLEVKDPKVRVMGLYGIGGIGKTTICKVLCNKLFKEFRGRVCHTELKREFQLELFQEVLKILTDTRHDNLERMNIDKCKDQLRRCIVKQPIFLAIDNVDEDSAEQAKTYLRAKYSFGNGSVVVVTSRSLSQLLALNIHEDDCLGMPELELREARDLFRNHAKSIGIGDVEYELDERIVARCVQMCRFNKGDGESFHYHPLALTVLGNEVREQMACNNFDPTLWYSRFSRIEESYKVLETKKQIFSILRISYDTLKPNDKMLFMDVALFMRNSGSWDSKSFDSVGPNLYEWLEMVHGLRKPDELKTRLEKLEKKSLLEKVGDGSTDVVMHDLWREFCVAETKVGEFAERRWVYFEEGYDELEESTPSGSCWENLGRMYFMSEAGVQKFLGLRLNHFKNVKVLRVRDALIARDPMVTVDLGEMKHLKYLEIRHDWRTRRYFQRVLPMADVEVQGLQSLTNLAFLQWVGMPEEVGYAEGIGRLTNLQFLKLPYCRGNTLPDMSSLTSLRMAFFPRSGEVDTIRGLTGKLSKLQYLNLADCEKLRSCPGVGDLLGLEVLDISGCWQLEELPNLGKLRNLTDLNMNGCSFLTVCPGLCGLRNLLRMDISFCSLSTLPSLSGLVSLEELSACHCSNLAIFPDMRNLRKLQVLNILGCPVTSLPGFEGLIALRELKASFELLEDRPALHNFTSLRHVEIEGWDRRGLMSIAKHAMLESLNVLKCETRGFQLDLTNMERLQRLEFHDGKIPGHLKGLRLAFSDSESTNGRAKNTCQSKVVNIWGCPNLELLDLVDIPGLQKLAVRECALRWLRIKEPLGALQMMNRNGPRDWERTVSNVSGPPGLQELYVTECQRFIRFAIERPLSALKKLDLSGCQSLVALPDLCYFPQLKTFDLHDCKRLTALNSLTVPLLALEKLDLTRCTSLTTLPDLGNFPNLKKLNLRRCKSLTGITSDKPLAALKKVNLRRCANVKALPDLANFPQLKTLDLRHCESLTSFSCSVPLLALENLYPNGCIRLKLLPDLGYFPGLKSLRLRDCKSLIKITSEGALPAAKLEVLKLWRCDDLVALPDLGSFPGLKSLRLRDCKSLIRITSEGARLPALQMLKLWRCNGLVALPDLGCFPDLRWLCLRDCKRLTSVNSGVPLLALHSLVLGGCVRLKQIADLSKFPSLRWIDLEMCKSLLSLTSSEPLLALRLLNAKRCRSLKALPDHLCSSVELEYLGVGGSGIKLSEDTVCNLLASCVQLESVDTTPLGEDRDWDDCYEWDYDPADDDESDHDFDESDHDFDESEYDDDWGSDMSLDYSDSSDSADEDVSGTD
ncbi:hypothetical protein KC19_5G153200 [Ceratodon purpureus]|uniref:TIR domain-containing protein n=1 Tax=Ceratodon purpureus TaxID=3225 RepID=A0A8T0I4B5_CERPU|nr:hypothetical protein KC19_5G153200 [Ceratodon purpureus]